MNPPLRVGINRWFRVSYTPLRVGFTQNYYRYILSDKKSSCNKQSAINKSINKRRMKKVVIILTSLVMILCSFTQMSSLEPRTTEETARNIITAFQHASPEEFALLFPTISEFHELMKQNDAIYGPYSEEARYEFEVDYERYLLPKVKSAFASVITQGKQKGIDWKRARFVKVEVVSRPSNAVTLGQISLVFAVDSEEYTLHIDNAFYLNGQWKVTQFLTLG
jgi:hypothetical protein